MGTGPEGWFQTPSIKAGFHGNDPTPGIFVFFSVPDLEEAIAKVRELGGEAAEPSEEPITDGGRSEFPADHDK